MGTLHRPAFSSPFSSKRFVVALCAAIAMVLGAMSVGAHIPDASTAADTPTATGAPAQANVIVRERGGATLSHPVAADREQRLSHQTPILITQANPTPIVDPKSATGRSTTRLELALKLKPIDTAVTLSTDPLQVSIDTPILDLPAALLPIGGITSDLPLQGSQPPESETIPPPTTQQNTEETPVAP